MAARARDRDTPVASLLVGALIACSFHCMATATWVTSVVAGTQDVPGLSTSGPATSAQIGRPIYGDYNATSGLLYFTDRQEVGVLHAFRGVFSQQHSYVQQTARYPRPRHCFRAAPTVSIHQLFSPDGLAIVNGGLAFSSMDDVEFIAAGHLNVVEALSFTATGGTEVENVKSDTLGGFYAANLGAHRVRRVDASFVARTVAGTCYQGWFTGVGTGDSSKVKRSS